MKKPYSQDYDNITLFNEIEKLRKNFALVCQIQECGEKSCESHTISRSYILDKLASNGHVLMPTRLRKNSKKIGLERVGIKDATIFKCICSKHDNNLFKDLDVSTIDITPKSMFLLNLRCFYQLYYKIYMEKNIHEIICKSYEISSNTRIMDYHNWLSTYLKFLENTKNEMNRILKEEKFDKYNYYYTEFAYELGFAVSSPMCFSHDIKGNIIEYSKNNPTVYYLNILPQKSKTIMIISYKKDDNYAEHFVNQLINLSESELIRYFNLTLCIDVENIVISERLYDLWDQKAKQEYDDILTMNLKYDLSDLQNELFATDRLYSFFI